MYIIQHKWTGDVIVEVIRIDNDLYTVSEDGHPLLYVHPDSIHNDRIHLYKSDAEWSYRTKPKVRVNKGLLYRHNIPKLYWEYYSSRSFYNRRLDMVLHKMPLNKGDDYEEMALYHLKQAIIADYKRQRDLA